MKRKRSGNRPSLKILVLGLALILLAKIIGTTYDPIYAQEQLIWSPPEVVPGYDNEVSRPFLVADQNRTVHMFASTWIEGERVIAYSNWTKAQGWTLPIDIILPQLEDQTRLEGGFLDEAGNIHLVFFSGNDQRSNIYYSRAPLIEAGRAPVWTTPQVIGEAPLTPQEAEIVGDGQDALFVLYAGRLQQGHGVYFTYSIDSGNSWSVPAPMYLTYSNELWPSALKMYRDNQGTVHAVWSVANIEGNSEAIYYSNLDSENYLWNEPVELAQAVDIREVDTPSIISYDRELFVIYHDDEPTTRHMLLSTDGGQTWSEKTRLFEQVGSNGPASLVIDSSDRLHMFFGNRVTLDFSSEIVHGMWHSIWLGTQWSRPEAIVQGPRVTDDVGGVGFDPSFADAVVSQGNVILVTWTQDPGAGKNGVWYSYTTLDTPELLINTLPTPLPTPAVTLVDVPPTISPTAEPLVLANEIDTTNLSNNPASPLLISLLPIFILIGTAIIVRGLWLWKR